MPKIGWQPLFITREPLALERIGNFLEASLDLKAYWVCHLTHDIGSYLRDRNKESSTPKSCSVPAESSRRAATLRAMHPGIESVSRALRSFLLLEEDFCYSE